jgi:glycosyltransferase involved in cell wall biosynthesis
MDLHELSLVEDKPIISLVVPTYNEEEVIEELIKRIDSVVAKTGLTYELIVVDDGSVDNTRRKLTTFVNGNGYYHVKVIGYDKNIGKGYAVKTGFAHSRGEIVVFLDSDLEIDPEQITVYVEALRKSDIVVASKWHPNSKVEMPLLRKVLSRGFNLLVRFLTGIRLGDTQTGLKAVRRKPLEKVFSRITVKRYAFDVELLTVASLHGLKIAELPVKMRIDRSLFSPRDIWKMLIDLLAITYRLRIIKWYE